MRSFLTGRRERVQVESEYLNKTNVTSGTSQGGILGPVLLTIFINVLPEVIEVNFKEFADYTKIYEDSKKLWNHTLKVSHYKNLEHRQKSYKASTQM